MGWGNLLFDKGAFFVVLTFFYLGMARLLSCNSKIPTIHLPLLLTSGLFLGGAHLIKGDFLGRQTSLYFFGAGKPSLDKGVLFWGGTHLLAIARHLFVGGILAICPHIPIIYIRVSHTTRTHPHGLPHTHLPTLAGSSVHEYSPTVSQVASAPRGYSHLQNPDPHGYSHLHPPPRG